MANTLFDIVLKVYREIGQLRREQITGGSTTEVVVDGLKKGGRGSGTAFITATDGLAPDREYKKISSYKRSTSTFTIPVLTAAVASGDFIHFTSNRYPIFSIIDFINDGLEELLGTIELTDESITIEANKKEYDLPVILKRDPRAIYLNSILTDSDSNDWGLVPGWRIEPTAAAAVGRLIFNQQHLKDATVRIVYTAFHDTLVNMTDTIHESIPARAVVLAGAIKALQNNFSKGGGASSKKQEIIRQKEEALDLLLRMAPITKLSGSMATSGWKAER